MSDDMDSAVNDALGQYQCIAALTAENERLRESNDTKRKLLDEFYEAFGPDVVRAVVNIRELRSQNAELRRALGKISKDTFCLGPGCPYCAAETDHPSSYAAKVARAALEDKA